MGKLNVDGTEIQVLQIEEDDYISLTDMVRKIDNGTALIEKWLRNKNIIEFLGNLENIVDTAKRELYEETGALDFEIKPVCVYSVTRSEYPDRGESFGMLFFADIQSFEAELHSEIEKIAIMDELPERWTYPDIQPHLIDEAMRLGYL